MKSPYLADEWVLDQAILTLNLCHSITPDHILMDRLVFLSEKFLAKVTEVFRLIVEYRVSDKGFYGWLDKAEKLAIALMKTETKDVGIKIIHKLGAYGFNQSFAATKKIEGVMVETKDVVYLIIGLVLGLWVGIALYWLPLGQSLNEWRALFHLVFKRYKRGDVITVSAGTDLKPVDSQLQPATITSSNEMSIWHDEGVGWHHTHSGWKRARVLHVFNQGSGVSPVYKICHLDLVK